MKVNGARTAPVYGSRRGPAAVQEAYGAAAPSLIDAVSYLGLTEYDLTPQVRTALHALFTTVDELRTEVAELKGQLLDLKGLADRDTLTPLFNRRAFMRELSRARAFGERYGATASLIFFDLDGFKSINDRFGHAAGDVALQAVAERLAVNLRETDIAARLGGDEFAVILVQADRAVAEAKAEALACAIEAEPVELGEWSAPLRLSFGVQEIDADAEVVLSRADAAMYASKRARRAARA